MIETGPLVLGAVLVDLQAIMAANVNSNRVFLPAMSAATRLLSDARLGTVSQRGDTTKALIGILCAGCKGMPQIKSIDRITGSLKL